MVPNRFHFVWYGSEFPLTHAVAIRSVAKTCSPEAINVHTPDDLERHPLWNQLRREIPMLCQRRLDLDGMLRRASELGVNAAPLAVVYDRFLSEGKFAALSDIVRYLVLLCEGGVYLDFDVIGVRDLAPLRAGEGFCGRERILVPAAVHRRSGALRYLRTAPLDLARLACSAFGPGVRLWQKIERVFPAAINGAVLGLRAGHPLAVAALNEVPARAADVDRRRPAIGPDLLQDLIDGQARKDIDVLPPAAFYPLGPTMAAQYFAQHPQVHRQMDRVVTPNTFIVHWYNDDRRNSHKPVNAESVSRLARRQMFSRLAMPYVRAAT